MSMVEIKGPKPIGVGQGPSPLDPTVAKKTAKEISKTALEKGDGFEGRLPPQIGTKPNQFMGGAFKVFGDGILFPSNLLDVSHSANNPRYLRLLAAVLGMDDLEWHFKTLAEEDHQAYVERKAKRRLERLEEEERQQGQEGAFVDDEDEEGGQGRD